MHTRGPRSLGNPREVADRRAMLLSSPTAAPLTEWLNRLILARKSAGLPAEMPYADPLDAGIEARVLIVLEAPGPMTSAVNTVPGSGFISSDNDDASAENLWLARKYAGLVDGVLIGTPFPGISDQRNASRSWLRKEPAARFFAI